MSYIHSADVHVEFFTPPEFPVEILNEAKEKNLVPCCLTPNAKQFVTFMLLKEYYYKYDGILVFIQDDGQFSPSTQSLNLDSSADSGYNDIDPDALGPEKAQKLTTGTADAPPPSCEPPLESLSSIPVIDLRDKTKTVEHQERLKRLLDEELASAVIICTRKDFLAFAKPCSLDITSNLLSRLRLIIMDNVHEALRDTLVRAEVIDILSLVKQCNELRVIKSKPRIGMVYMTVSLLHYYGYESNGFWRMEETFRKLERLCEAKVDTSSDIVALLRYCAPLTERIISYSRGLLSDVSQFVTLEVKQILDSIKKFLNEHHFNPVQVLGYSEEEWEEMLKARKEKELELAIKSRENDEEPTEENPDEDNDTSSLFDEVGSIQSPCIAPLQLIQQFESILDLFGPWCANRALYLLINQIRKMKTRVPYVRHYLLLGLLHSRFVLIQAAFQAKFDEFEQLEVLEKFSTPKLVTVLNVLRRFNLTTVHEGKLLRQQQELLQQQQEEYDDEGEVTVADYLNIQKQQQQQEQLTGRYRGGRSGGRRKGAARMQAQQKKAHKFVKFDDAEPITINETKYNKPESVCPAATGIGVNVEHKTEEAAPEQNTKSDSTTVVDSIVKSEPNSAITPSAIKEDKSASAGGDNLPNVGKYQRRNRNYKSNEDALCGIMLLEDRFHARLLYHFLREAADVDNKLIGLSPTIALSCNPEYEKDSREAEIEYKRREENLRKFRYREANFLVGTSLLEDGIELPKANLVIRFDESKSFRSYLFSKGRAQGLDAEYYVFTDEQNLTSCLRQLATYKTVEETLLAHTVIPKPNYEPVAARTIINDLQLNVPVFKSATLSTAISIVNRYCARLPSDTFTRLTPSWSIETTKPIEAEAKLFNSSLYFTCSLRLPINSPVKWPIQGIPMPTQALAKKAVAIQTVMVLHNNGELDDDLMPVGKEGVVQEPDLEVSSDVMDEEYGDFRPGSTRRRQYYDKQLAPELIDCLPEIGRPFHLYWLKMTLACPLPDEQNTRGRKLHPPEESSQCFGIALSNSIPPLPPFPIYTRCGEVLVELVRIQEQNNMHHMTTERLEKISTFHHYTFTSVLRLDKYLTLFDPNLSENSYYVVPLKSNGKTVKDGPVQIDWNFIDAIQAEKELAHPPPQDDESRKGYEFTKEKYMDAVVMPWYRNNDQPQYFYVAEICNNLTPRSQFPGCEFKTFEEYYRKKYKLTIQHPSQPLLDVDHTSARLNFLTPRYVNRKGMALPTSSETTKKAKRENLEQKQILVPELCAIHPFTASLWRQAVCLPCILYRLNALLMANNIRTLVASQVHGLGLISLPEDYKWKSLSFGWSLSDVFSSTSIIDPSHPRNMIKDKIETTTNAVQDEKEKAKSKDKKPDEKEKENISTETSTKASELPNVDSKSEKSSQKPPKLSGFEKAAKEGTPKNIAFGQTLLGNKTLNEILSEQMKKCRQPQLEIGVWSNDMAAGGTSNEPDFDEEEDELLDPNIALPSNLMMLDQKVSWGGRYKLFNHKVHRALYGSPTHWGEVWDRTAFEPPEDFEDLDTASLHSDMSGGSDESFLDGDNNLKIQFEGNTAEALDKRKFGTAFEQRPSDEFRANEGMWWGENDNNKDQGDTNEKDKEEDALKEEFEKKVEGKIGDIQNVFKWNEVGNIPPRSGKKPTSMEEEENEMSKACKELMMAGAPLHPPQSVEPAEKCLEVVKYDSKLDPGTFSFDYQPPLKNHVGPSPCQILQAMTMSNANDGLNLERLETIGDSFLKYAITTYLFCTYENLHEGKLSHLRSKQVSNVHLYRLGRQRGLGGIMIAAKFEPHDNWLPPCYHISKDLDKALIHSKLPHNHFSMAQVTAMKGMTKSEIEEALKSTTTVKFDSEFIPYNLVTQQSIPDKSIADSVEALIGAYLTSTGPSGALLFMSWLGVRVLPSKVIPEADILALQLRADENGTPLYYMKVPDKPEVIVFQDIKPPASPLLRYEDDCDRQLEILLKGYHQFEESIGYKFRDRSYLLQAFTHASYAENTLTDCYQRLEFLGDAILDYLITRHLYEDPRQHSPGSLTDLRSALVNNTIFASLAVKNGFHKYFRHASPGLAAVLQKFVTFQEQHAHTLTQDYYLMGEEECEEAEDIEVPKALGDVFESVAGAIYLDSGMSLDAVWSVYYKIMKNEIEQFSQNVPKSPIRELLELEPETAKFGKPEKLYDGRRVRVMVEIYGLGVFRGIGRNYRIAKCTAAKCALRHVRKQRLKKLD